MYIEGGEEVLNSLEGRYLQTISNTKVRLNNKVAGLTKLGKTQRHLVCCALYKSDDL
jgi:hypothetical protein